MWDPAPFCRSRAPTRATTRCIPNGACSYRRPPDASKRRGDDGGRIVAVGTTSLRLLESAAGETGEVRHFAGETRLFILPGHRFRAIDLLLTNFHLPRSTLFMLVTALAGHERIKAAYAHAIAAGYRFFSFGDACLIERR